MIDHRIETMAKDHLSKDVYDLYEHIRDLTPLIWHKPTSSSGKYHLNINGKPDTINSHVLSMLNTALVLFRAFPEIDANPKTKDILILSITFHDAMKYGPDGTYLHTVSNHDYKMEEWLDLRRKKILDYFNREEFILFKFCVKYHSGRWGGKKQEKEKFKWDEYPIFCFFLHMLDMLSSNHLIKDELYE